jgi:hypothetical protein
VHVQLQLADGYDAIRFAFEYTCIFPLLDMRYQRSTASEDVAWEDVMDNSRVAPLWTNHSILIGAEEQVSYFSLELDAATDPALSNQWYTFHLFADESDMDQPIVDDPQGSYAPRAVPATQLPGTAVHSSPRASLRALVTGGSGGVDVRPSLSDPKLLAFKWRCGDKLLQTTAVHVDLSLTYGWTGLGTADATYPAFAMLRFQKMCPVGVPESGEVNGSGMSAAGIFFLTVFLLGVVLCIVFSVWNYVREGTRGWDIIPGSEKARALLARARGRGAAAGASAEAFSPQMDDNTAAASRSGYGAFGAGDRYQDNL